MNRPPLSETGTETARVQAQRREQRLRSGAETCKKGTETGAAETDAETGKETALVQAQRQEPLLQLLCEGTENRRNRCKDRSKDGIRDSLGARAETGGGFVRQCCLCGSSI
eukprot:3220766-Rhodomonas_salina.1